MSRRQKSRQTAADSRSPPASAAAASGASSGRAPVSLGGVRLAQPDPGVQAMAEQLAAAMLGTSQPDDPLREKSMEALCATLVGATDAATAADTLRMCAVVTYEDGSNAEKLLNGGAVAAALACMRRFSSAEDVQHTALVFFNQLGLSGVGWERFVQTLRKEGVESIAADLIAAAHTVPGDIGLAVIGGIIVLMPELGPITARDTALLEKALQLAAGGGEDPTRPLTGALQLFAALVKCPDPAPLAAVAAVPQLVPTLLATLRKAHTAGRSNDVLWTLHVLSAGAGYGDSRLAGTVANVGDDATFKLILRLASDADDTVAMNAAALSFQINVYNRSPRGSPLTRCSNVVPALLAAIRATGGATPPGTERDQAACFATSVLGGVLIDLSSTTPAGSVTHLLTAAASDIIDRLAHILEQDTMALSALPTVGPMLGYAIESCVVSGRPGQLKAVPRAMLAAARAVTGALSRGGDDAATARSIYPVILSRMLYYSSRLADGLHAARGCPWSLAQLEDQQAAVQALLRALEACQGPGRGWEMQDVQQRMMRQLDVVIRRAQQQQRRRGEAPGARAAGQQQPQQPQQPQQDAPVQAQDQVARPAQQPQQQALPPAPQRQQPQQQQQQQQQQRSAPAPAAIAAAPVAASAAGPAQPLQAAAVQVVANGNASSTAAPAHTCARCGAVAGPGGAKLMRCAGCREVRYCGEACATAAWKGHKRACRALQAAMAAAAAAASPAGAQATS